MKKVIQQIFKVEKPIIGMLHLRGDTPEEVLQIAREEADMMFNAGVNAVLVEDYFGSPGDVVNVLKMMQSDYADKVYGVNLLGDFVGSYRLAQQYGAAFMQVDSICGHLTPEEEKTYFAEVDACRADGDVFVLGGVRFKYQPVRSGRSVKDDLNIGKQHCDAIVVTGVGTGIETDLEKIKRFRGILGDFPLIVGAGMSAETAKEQLLDSDGGIVGSYFKKDGEANLCNPMIPERVQRFMQACR
ncbi:MAG: membrane biogenesis protein [Clostridia bacterium]|nr:membrane biogenesis protein [Clostridia bacterium]